MTTRKKSNDKRLNSANAHLTRSRKLRDYLGERVNGWALAEKSYTDGETLELSVIGYNRAGLLVDLGDVRGFVPASQLLSFPRTIQEEERVQQLARYVGQPLRLMVFELDRTRHHLILSERLARPPVSRAELTEQGFVGIGVFDERIQLVSLSKDGQYRFVDGTEKLHNILYVATAGALAIESAIEELEYLMNDPKATEQAFQDFFERNPRLILNDEYRKAHPHITLAREEGPLIPDFLLEPLDQNSLSDILDLKLPTAKIFVLKQSRMRYSAAVMEACAQLREYNNYFDEKENRDRIFHEYGLLTYKPKMIVIIGRKGGVDPISFQKIRSDVPQLVLRTYDDVLHRAKARLQELK